MRTTARRPHPRGRRPRGRRRRGGPVGAFGSALAIIPFAAVIVLAVQVGGVVARDAPAEPGKAALPAIPAEPAPRGDVAEDTEPDAAPTAADASWVERVASATGIPSRAVQAYAEAELVLAAEQPRCGIAWNTLAGIGDIESGHGSHGGASLAGDGWVAPRIVGPRLDGGDYAAIGDTDGGAWDGDAEWDRAVGPLQFIPETWRHWGADGNGDGARDPNQIDDAALAAARYLCRSGSMDGTEAWRTAVFTYNQLTSYVDDVAARASTYARRAGGA